ncbi:MAG TPA: spermidine/putrescine ABC transporter [Rhodospirillaceae bacterium]|nr:spermidine/putrescine ABC transporter [Rhodospirillaceae bacterium]MAX65069.1 spermidine/putrescine ABC transporter [Rhodospirillaceae bacterium]MBB56174.1 spermidine/putrescine ABC transporter [Rhodospirillaceae bacterium]HAE00657.1 spermidine/putrescine ABC transporter [Rhodospirillaceae bacterium]HBM11842.1 spermidine/putrescine ABC transporter [Rhodospirillaceae bacterium]|tara:strand:+ start:8879 stop:9733 length:855 start_codon:yes stop_codon:yes gene_type:complete
MSRRSNSPYFLLTPAMLTTVATLAICMVVLMVLAVARQSYLDIDLTFSTHNVELALTSPLILKLMVKSALISFGVTLLSLVLAYPIAYLLAFDLTRNKLLWLMLFTLPCWISYLLRVLSWKLILGYQGMINTSLMGLGIIDQPIEALLYNSTSVVIALTHAWAPFAILPIYVSLEKIDRSLIRASGDLSDTPMQTFFRVILPLSLPGVTAAFVLVFIPTFGDYVTPHLLGGPTGVMIGNFIAMQFGASNNWPLGAAVALLAMLVATLLVCIFIAGSRHAIKAIR